MSAPFFSNFFTCIQFLGKIGQNSTPQIECWLRLGNPGSATDLVKFSRELYENKKNLAERSGARLRAPFRKSANDLL